MQSTNTSKTKTSLPLVQSYPLDIPEDRDAREVFNKQVDALTRRITGSKVSPSSAVDQKHKTGVAKTQTQANVPVRERATDKT
jgi:hypothetical protein